MFLQYLQPGFFSAESSTAEQRQALARRVDRAALIYTAAAVAGLAVLCLVTPWLVGPIIRENYRPALRLLLPAGGFALATQTGLFFHSMLLAGRRESACGPVDLTAAGVLVAGGVGAAAIGEAWFLRWLIVTPLVPWLIQRPLARRSFFHDA